MLLDLLWIEYSCNVNYKRVFSAFSPTAMLQVGMRCTVNVYRYVMWPSKYTRNAKWSWVSFDSCSVRQHLPRKYTTLFGRRFNVFQTLYERSQMDVKTTLCAYWETALKLKDIWMISIPRHGTFYKISEHDTEVYFMLSVVII